MSNNQISRKRTILILISIMASLLLSSLDSTVVSTAMKKIVDSLGGMQYYSWPFTIYMLCSTLAIPICGGLSDIYGHKPMFMAGIIIFITGSIFCGLSGTMIHLIIFRGLQGIGGGMIVSGVFIIIADLFKPSDRGKYTGIVTSMYGVSSIIGPLLGGFITDNLGWKWIFFMNIPLALFAFIMIALTMPGFKSGDSKKSVDYAGIIVLILTLIPMLLDFKMAGDSFAWLSVPCFSMFAFSAIMLIIFILVEKKSSNPLIPLHFFKDRAISISFLIAFFSQAVMFAAIMYIPYFIQGIIGSTATTSGAVITPMMIGLLVASNMTGMLNSKLGKSRIFSVIAFIIMIIGATLLSTMGINTSYKTAIIYMIILGFGIGISMPITNVNAQNAAPKQQVGSVTSSVMFFRNMGSTIGSAINGVIMANALNSGFAKINMGHLPSTIQVALKNPQVITNAQTIAKIQSHVPKMFLSYFNNIYTNAKGVLSTSIHDVFAFCTGIAVIGFVTALLLKDAPFNKADKTAKQ